MEESEIDLFLFLSVPMGRVPAELRHERIVSVLGKPL